jgi:hypothetical protein
MDQTQIRNRLSSIYERWRGQFDAQGLPIDQFSPPLLLNPTKDYCGSALKIIVYGQETTGWDWTHRLQKEYPAYPQNWPFKDLQTFQDFLANDDAIEGLMWGYDQFAFAKHQPRNYRSPFWQAVREIQKWPNAGVMHANLVRADYDWGSVFHADSKTMAAFLRQQGALTRDELKVLGPDICIFLTGPDYDSILESAFPQLGRKQVGSAPDRELAQLVHADLPARSYRTYHPRALRTLGKWDYLELIRASATH